MSNSSANPHQGEVALETPGGTWVLKLSARAAATMENRFDVPLITIFGQIDAGSIRHIAAFLSVTATPPMADDDVYAVMDEIGARAVQDRIMEAIKLAGLLKGAGKSKDKAATKNPPQATAAV